MALDEPLAVVGVAPFEQGEAQFLDGVEVVRPEDLLLVGAARVLDSEGDHRIRDGERGSVDQPAGVDFRSAVGRIEASPVQLGLNYYREDRRDGTPAQVNRLPHPARESGRRFLGRVWPPAGNAGR